jgi:hypothetical protein
LYPETALVVETASQLMFTVDKVLDTTMFVGVGGTARVVVKVVPLPREASPVKI